MGKRLPMWKRYRRPHRGLPSSSSSSASDDDQGSNSPAATNPPSSMFDFPGGNDGLGMSPAAERAFASAQRDAIPRGLGSTSPYTADFSSPFARHALELSNANVDGLVASRKISERKARLARVEKKLSDETVKRITDVVEIKGRLVAIEKRLGIEYSPNAERTVLYAEAGRTPAEHFDPQPNPDLTAYRLRIKSLESAVANERARADNLEKERDDIREKHERLLKDTEGFVIVKAE